MQDWSRPCEVAGADSSPAKGAPDEPVLATDEKDWDRHETRRVANRDLKWFKVRVTEKGSKRSRVNINLPIALVRAPARDIGRHIGRIARRAELIEQ